MKNSPYNLKYIIGICLFGLTLSSALAQNVSYKILEDDPGKVRDSYAAIEFLNFEFGSSSRRNLNTLGVGGNFIYALDEKIGIDGNIRLDLVKEKAAPFVFSVDFGGFKSTSSKTKTKEIKVRLGVKHGTDVNSDGNTVNTQSDLFIMVPATQLRTTALRGGIYFNRRTYDKRIIPMTLGGVYGGFMFNRKTNLKIELTDNGGSKDIGGKIYNPRGFQKTYVDLILTPLAVSGAGIPSGPSSYKNKLIGVRVGTMMYLDGPKWYNKFMFGVESGVRPYSGFFLKANIGLQLFKLPSK